MSGRSIKFNGDGREAGERNWCALLGRLSGSACMHPPDWRKAFLYTGILANERRGYMRMVGGGEVGDSSSGNAGSRRRRESVALETGGVLIAAIVQVADAMEPQSYGEMLVSKEPVMTQIKEPILKNEVRTEKEDRRHSLHTTKIKFKAVFVMEEGEESSRLPSMRIAYGFSRG